MYPDVPQLNNTTDPFHTKRVDKAFKLGDMANSAISSLGKSLKASTRPNEEAIPSYRAKAEENRREIGTHAAADDTIASLQAKAAKGEPTEISGDALARSKKGQTPKLHRSI